jgi:hypothetical protein
MLSKNIYIIGLLANAIIVLAGPVSAPRSFTKLLIGKPRDTEVARSVGQCYNVGSRVCCEILDDSGNVVAFDCVP